MSESGVAVAQLSGWRAVSRYQWLVFAVVWAGWTLDAADFGLYSLVLRPAMIELLGGNPSLADIGRYGGLLAMTGLLGWAFGGFVFGILADYIGRVRTLAFSIAIYALFTALQGLSHGIWDFAVYRFIAGLGTGAELMVGIPLLAETLGETHRAKIAGVHDDRRRDRHLCRLLGLWPGRRLWLALCLLPRHRAGDPLGGHPPADARARPLRRRAASGARRSPRAVRQQRTTISSCALCRCSCSTRRIATTRWSACCSASDRCWRSGPPTSGCRRSCR